MQKEFSFNLIVTLITFSLNFLLYFTVDGFDYKILDYSVFSAFFAVCLLMLDLIFIKKLKIRIFSKIAMTIGILTLFNTFMHMIGLASF